MPSIIPKQLFPQITENLIKEFEKKGSIKLLEPGDIILSENSNIRNIPIVISGSLKVSREDSDGKELLLYYIKPGESCVMSLFGSLHHDTSKIKAVAEEKTEVLMLPIDDMNTWVKEYPDWVAFILYLYHKRFEELLEIVNDVAFHKIDERILHLLKKKANLNHQPEIITTHQQIADELGTSREVVSRLLKQLEKEGEIKLSRNKIQLL